MPPLFRALRPGQWVKNLFVLAPLVFGRAVGHPDAVARAVAAFAAFCAVASALYLVNDVLDAPSDREHPRKKERPVASGALSVRTALGAAVVLLAGGLLLAGRMAPEALPAIGVYAALIALYSTALKNVSLLDVFIIAAGFVLRVLAGAAAARVVPSHWLLLCTFFVALFLALSKRRGELVLRGPAGRPSLAGVTAPLLESFENVAMGTTIVSYALYTVAPETVQWYGSDRLLLTVPFVVFGLFRWRVVETRGGGEDATNDLFTDRGLLLTVLLWGATCVALIYLVRPVTP